MIRALIFVVLASGYAVSPSLAGEKQTPWELYLQQPSAERAHGVERVEYSNIDLAAAVQKGNLMRDLEIVEYEVAAGSTESMQLLFRINLQFPNGGDLSERIAEIAGRGIRSNPTAYLSAVAKYDGHCLGVDATGDFFVDRTSARDTENRARAAALKSVRNSKLDVAKEECLRHLSAVDQTRPK